MKTLRISDNVWRKLQLLKIDWKKKSVDAVIQELLERLGKNEL